LLRGAKSSIELLEVDMVYSNACCANPAVTFTNTAAHSPFSTKAEAKTPTDGFAPDLLIFMNWSSR
jgi:hypothetical protein